jgi:hypothetical protein
MATLSGQKVKNAFSSLLKLATNTATTTLKNVESGDGVATALQIATTKVGVNGILEFPTVPATGSTETSALFLNASNQVIKRTLNAAAFSGGAVTTATLPLAITSSTVRLDNPSSISDIGTIANGDRFLIYDVSTTSWRRIDYSNLKSLINPGGYQSAPEFVLRASDTFVLTVSPQVLEFFAIGAGAGASNKVGAGGAYFSLSSVYGGTNDSVTTLADGILVEITIAASLTTTGAGPVVKFDLEVNGAVVDVSETPLGAGGDHHVTQAFFLNLNAGEVVSVRASETGGGTISLDEFSVLHLRVL